MTFKVSTGLRNGMLSTNSLSALMAGGFIKIYNGVEPASADAALAGNTLLCTISVNDSGTGLTFDAAVDGVLPKAAAEVWEGTNAASGTATFYRFVLTGDTGALSTTEKRMQGSIGLAGADMNMTSVTLVAAAVQPINYFVVALPTS